MEGRAGAVTSQALNGNVHATCSSVRVRPPEAFDNFWDYPRLRTYPVTARACVSGPIHPLGNPPPVLPAAPLCRSCSSPRVATPSSPLPKSHSKKVRTSAHDMGVSPALNRRRECRAFAHGLDGGLVGWSSNTDALHSGVDTELDDVEDLALSRVDLMHSTRTKPK